MVKKISIRKKENESTIDCFNPPDGSGMPENLSPKSDDTESSWQDILVNAARSLKPQVPLTQESNIPDEKNESEQIIDQANDNAINAQSSMLALISQNEKARLDKQKPVLYWVIFFVGSQLFVFNGIIVYVIISAVLNPDNGNFSLMFEFLKYYIGAVLVELIGMIAFITQSTFASPTKQMLKIIKYWTGKDESDEK